MSVTDGVQNLDATARDDLLPTEDAVGRRTGQSAAQLNASVRESDIAQQSSQPASLARGDVTATTVGARDAGKKDFDVGGADVRESQLGSGTADVVGRFDRAAHRLDDETAAGKH
jgi:hypothetical protein